MTFSFSASQEPESIVKAPKWYQVESDNEARKGQPVAQNNIQQTENLGEMQFYDQIQVTVLIMEFMLTFHLPVLACIFLYSHCRIES